MFEIVISVLANFFALVAIFVVWKLLISVRRVPLSKIERPFKFGERTAHSNLSLVTLGLVTFFVFPILLVGVRWADVQSKVDLSGHLHVLGFLLTGVVSYWYFVRALRGGSQ